MSKLCVCLWLVACAALVAAQVEKGTSSHTRPDMSGVWTRDRARSDFGALGQSPEARADLTLTIAQHEPEIKMTRRLRFDGREQTQELTYYTDGRGELNPSTLGRVGVKSRTRWDGARLVSEAKLVRQAPGGATFEIDSTEKWQLSADGRTLTQTDTISTPRGAQTVRQVYERQP